MSAGITGWTRCSIEEGVLRLEVRAIALMELLYDQAWDARSCPF